MSNKTLLFCLVSLIVIALGLALVYIQNETIMYYINALNSPKVTVNTNNTNNPERVGGETVTRPLDGSEGDNTPPRTNPDITLYEDANFEGRKKDVWMEDYDAAHTIDQMDKSGVRIMNMISTKQKKEEDGEEVEDLVNNIDFYYRSLKINKGGKIKLYVAAIIDDEELSRGWIEIKGHIPDLYSYFFQKAPDRFRRKFKLNDEHHKELKRVLYLSPFDYSKLSTYNDAIKQQCYDQWNELSEGDPTSYPKCQPDEYIKCRDENQADLSKCSPLCPSVVINETTSYSSSEGSSAKVTPGIYGRNMINHCEQKLINEIK